MGLREDAATREYVQYGESIAVETSDVALLHVYVESMLCKYGGSGWWVSEYRSRNDAPLPECHRRRLPHFRPYPIQKHQSVGDDLDFKHTYPPRALYTPTRTKSDPNNGQLKSRKSNF